MSMCIWNVHSAKRVCAKTFGWRFTVHSYAAALLLCLLRFITSVGTFVKSVFGVYPPYAHCADFDFYGHILHFIRAWAGTDTVDVPFASYSCRCFS